MVTGGCVLLTGSGVLLVSGGLLLTSGVVETLAWIKQVNCFTLGAGLWVLNVHVSMAQY